MSESKGSETPRTDALQDSMGGDCCREAFNALELARQLEREVRALREALESIAANTCCDKCQEAALVARAALSHSEEGKP